MSAKYLIQKLSDRLDLNHIECDELSEIIFNQASEPLQIAALLALLHAKGESPSELYYMERFLREHSNPVQRPQCSNILDIVGTGGDNSNTVNISTGAAILCASTGIKIGKHGNRSVSSLSGAADVLEALGINIHLSSEKIARGIDQFGIGFYFAPNFYPAMQTLKDLRKKLNIPTMFNILGPLLNPIHPDFLIIGAKNKSLQQSIAQVLALKNTRALIVHCEGLDEISCVGLTDVIEVHNKTLNTYTIDPKDYGLRYCHIAELKGGNAKQNADLLIHAFENINHPITQTLILNCAVGLAFVGKTKSIHEGIQKAQEALQAGKPLAILNQWRNAA